MVQTVPNTEYVLKLAYDTHATCTSKTNVLEMDVVIDGKTVKRLQHEGGRAWDLKWTVFKYDFKASSDSSRLEFISKNDGCGCIVLDDVTVRPKQCRASTQTTTFPTMTTRSAVAANFQYGELVCESVLYTKGKTNNVNTATHMILD